MLTLIGVISAIDFIANLFNSKLLEVFLDMTGEVGGWIQGVLILFDKYGIYTMLKLFFVAAIIISVQLYKRSYVDLYSVLRQMSENNKLHPVRAKVMSTYKSLTHGHNPFTIEDSKFNYRILPTENPQIYNVQYTLSFVLKMTKRNLWFANFQKRSFRFYAITDSEHGYVIKECFCCEGNDKRYYFQPILHDVTRMGNGGDKIQRYSGLQEIVFPLPNDISKNTRYAYSICYVCPKNLHAKDQRYSFAIIPDNYSKKIRNMSITVNDTCGAIKNLELQEFDGEEIRNPAAFVEKKISEEKGDSSTRSEHSFLYGPIKTNMNSIYFVQFDFQNHLDNKKQSQQTKIVFVNKVADK